MKDGCRDADLCISRQLDIHNNTCPGFCPIECAEDKINCTTRIDNNGCESSPECFPIRFDLFGNACPNQPCPGVCMETELLCYGDDDRIGCKEPDICVTKGTDFSGAPCNGNCPIKCDPLHEVVCDGQIVYEDYVRDRMTRMKEYGDDWNRDISPGCRGPNVCRTRAKDINGNFCPDASDSHGCPVTCTENQVLCPTGIDTMGCKGQALCYKRTTDRNGNFCPDDETADEDKYGFMVEKLVQT